MSDDPSEYEISIVRKNGEVRHLQVFRKEILWDGERQFQVIYQDITERKRAEEALRISLEKFTGLVESFPMGITISDKSGQIIEGNRQSEHLLGIIREVHASKEHRQQGMADYSEGTASHASR